MIPQFCCVNISYMFNGLFQKPILSDQNILPVTSCYHCLHQWDVEKGWSWWCSIMAMHKIFTWSKHFNMETIQWCSTCKHTQKFIVSVCNYMCIWIKQPSNFTLKFNVTNALHSLIHRIHISSNIHYITVVLWTSPCNLNWH